MSNFIKAFKALRKANGLKQSDFEGILGLVAISRFELNKADITSKKWMRCLEKMSASLSDYQAAMMEIEEAEKRFYIPVFDWYSIGKKNAKPIKFIPYFKGAGKHAFALEVMDESMIHPESAYPVGSYIIVEPTAHAENGEPVIVYHQRRYFFRRLLAGLAMPDNEGFEIIDHPTVVGRVVGTYWIS
ncbi:hypothetical protein VH1807_contig00024-0048 [Vibrio harveyi]|uniref:LexA family transcriptional regulator n=1 Tax=Vibrio harveyi TaxID=669 RepID=UPI0010FFAF07|nr:LexA family transcriptional regulator [Vibrio harveyi]GEA22330.1 hypothetical protein VH1807_contig00024-0048 [Vibrio harveyi]